MDIFNERNDRESAEIPVARLIRVGEVTTVDPAKLTCRVTFDDDAGYTSAELPVLQPNTFKNKDYALPDIGEDVLCLFLPGGVERGFVLGSFYAGNVTPPASSQDVREVKFSDGTVVKYDRSAHKLTADVKGDVSVKATGKIDVEAGGAVSIDSDSSVTISAAGAVTITGSTVIIG